MTMSGASERMRSAILSKLRVGLSWAISSFDAMPIEGSLLASSLAVPVPNSPDSWTITAVLATLLAALFSAPSEAMPSSTQTPKPGFRRNTFLRPRLIEQVGGADIDQEGRAVLGGGLAGGDADRALEAADIGGHALLVHLLDFADADLDLGLAVAQQRLELGATHRLDAARLVHVLDGHGAAEPALLAVIGDEAGDGMDHADLHGGGLGPDQAGRGDRPGRQRGAARDEGPARNRLHPLLGRENLPAINERRSSVCRQPCPRPESSFSPHRQRPLATFVPSARNTCR